MVAVSAVGGRPWAKQLRDYIHDHVQAMSAVSVRDPSAATEGTSDIDVVVVDDVVCLFDAAAITAAGFHNVSFVGLTDERAGGRGRDYLADLGVAVILDAATPPAEIAATIRALVPAPRRGRAEPARRSADGGDTRPRPLRPRLEGGASHRRRGPAYPLTVIQECCPGAGADELAILVGERFATGCATLVIEADETGSSLAGRLGLATDRCLPHALGLAGHGHHQQLFPAALTAGLDDGQPHPRLRFDVVAGAVLPGGPPASNPVHFQSLLEAATATYGETVVQVGPLITAAPGETSDRYAAGRGAVAAADRLVAVAAPTHNGVTELVNWLSAARAIVADTPAVAVFAHVPRSRFVRGALRRELERQTEAIATRTFDLCVLVPADKRADKAAWNGTRAPQSATRRAANALADHLTRYPALARSLADPATNGHRRRMGAAR